VGALARLGVPDQDIVALTGEKTERERAPLEVVSSITLCRAKREQNIMFQRLLPESQGQNLALTVLYVPCSLVTVLYMPCSLMTVLYVPCSLVTVLYVPCSLVTVLYVPCSLDSGVGQLLEPLRRGTPRRQGSCPHSPVFAMFTRQRWPVPQIRSF